MLNLRYWIFLALSALLFTTCDQNNSKSTRSGFFIEEPSFNTTPVGTSTRTPQIYYFFDRTISMQGYVSVDNSEYIRIIPQLWMVAESSALWPGSETTAYFHKFGEGDVRRVTRVYVRDRVRRRDFYTSPNDGTLVLSTGNRQVFATAARYITSEFLASKDTIQDKLFITVTDLYEQNREDNCFSALFKDAFENGLSGAIIAVQSGFNGSIENISDNLAANIRVTGSSTFFIFVIGHRDTLVKYCDSLFATADFQRLKTEKVLFLVGDESAPAELPWTPPVKNANSNRVFERIAYNNNINLKDDIPRLFTVNGNTVDPVKVESFRLLGNVRSQYIGGLPLNYIDPDSFNFESFFTVEHSSGGRITEGSLSAFETINDKDKTNFTVAAVNGNQVNDMDIKRYPIAVAINTKNDSLKKGCYCINFEIFQRAKIPQWVTDLNAATLDELNESNKQGAAVKILRLESIYRYITEAYNIRSEWRKIYTGSLYLEKQR